MLSTMPVNLAGARKRCATKGDKTMSGDKEKNQGQSGQYGGGQSGQQSHNSGQAGQPQQGNVDPNRKTPAQGDETDEQQNRQRRS
jgi:hypothetical protein